MPYKFYSKKQNSPKLTYSCRTFFVTGGALNELEKSILILTYSCRTAFTIYLPQITIFAKYYFVCTSLCRTKLLPVPRISFLVFLLFVYLFPFLIKYT